MDPLPKTRNMTWVFLMWAFFSVLIYMGGLASLQVSFSLRHRPSCAAVCRRHSDYDSLLRPVRHQDAAACARVVGQQGHSNCCFRS